MSWASSIQSIQVMKLLIMQFSPTSRHWISLRSKYSPQHPVLKHSQSMFLSSLNFFILLATSAKTKFRGPHSFVLKSILRMAAERISKTSVTSLTPTRRNNPRAELTSIADNCETLKSVIIHRWPVGLCKGDAVWFRWVGNWIFECQIALRPQSVHMVSDNEVSEHLDLINVSQW
jgi:hypothetical protein